MRPLLAKAHHEGAAIVPQQIPHLHIAPPHNSMPKHNLPCVKNTQALPPLPAPLQIDKHSLLPPLCSLTKLNPALPSPCTNSTIAVNLSDPMHCLCIESRPQYWWGKRNFLLCLLIKHEMDLCRDGASAVRIQMAFMSMGRSTHYIVTANNNKIHVCRQRAHISRDLAGRNQRTCLSSKPGSGRSRCSGPACPGPAEQSYSGHT